MMRPRSTKSTLLLVVVALVVASIFYVISFTSDPKGGDDGFVWARAIEKEHVPRDDSKLEEPKEEQSASRSTDGTKKNHKKKVLVVLQSSPENHAIRDIFRTELFFSAPVRLLFLVNPEDWKIPENPLQESSLQKIYAEKKVFNDILFYPPRNHSIQVSEEDKLHFVLENAPHDVDFIITASDNILLFMDHIYENLQKILSSGTEVSHSAYTKEGSIWQDVCILGMHKAKKGDKKDVPVTCAFGGNTLPGTLFEWIGGRCQSHSVYYLRNTGPAEVLRQFGRKVYIEHRRSKSFCREDWKEIATHNAVWKEMLEGWVSFAERHNIKWFLMSGPLIGAMRHQGFVPYDPDIDLMLLPESLEDAVRYLLEEESKLPFFLRRRDHPYLRFDEGRNEFHVNLPTSYHQISPYFKKGCKENCWDGAPLVAKVHHNKSCYGGPWGGGYVLDVFILPPQDMPSKLQTCLIEGLKVPCPADVDQWLTREIGHDWLVPQDDPEKVQILKLSNPFKACHELKKNEK